MQLRKPFIAVSLSFLVIISQAGCGSGGGSAPSAGSSLGGSDSGSSAGNTSTGAGTSSGGSAATGGTATDGSTTAGSTTAGSTTSGATASAGSTSSTGVAKLSWNPALDGATGFKVYYGTSPRSYSTTINVGMVSTYSLTGLAPGTYYFTVTAYDASGNESGYSNEASKTI